LAGPALNCPNVTFSSPVGNPFSSTLNRSPGVELLPLNLTVYTLLVELRVRTYTFCVSAIVVPEGAIAWSPARPAAGAALNAIVCCAVDVVELTFECRAVAVLATNKWLAESNRRSSSPSIRAGRHSTRFRAFPKSICPNIIHLYGFAPTTANRCHDYLKQLPRRPIFFREIWQSPISSPTQ
jgi:hypothetical protein